jgi:hypothetical protein
MAMPDTVDIALTDAERSLGFSVQTLTYPQGDYELSGLRAAGRSPRERTVALTLDDAARIRRQRHGLGYTLERREGEVWRVAGEFPSLEEIEAAGLCRPAPDLTEEREPTADPES